MTSGAVPPVIAFPRWTDSASLRSSRTVQFSVLALGLLVLRLADPDHPLPVDVCAFNAFTGLPCPTCGLTRAVCHALRGDWTGSLAYHPAGVLAAAALVSWTAWSAAEAVMGRSFAVQLRDRLSTWALTAGAALSVAGWIARLALDTWTLP